jgi:single-stranded DNA-binding protein
MINSVTEVGYVTNIKFHTYEDGGEVCNLLLGVRRSYKTNGKYHSDFINCKISGKRINTIKKFVKKGDLIGFKGELRSENAEFNGTKMILNHLAINKIHLFPKAINDEDLEKDLKPKNNEVRSKMDKKEAEEKIKENEVNVNEDDLPF